MDYDILAAFTTDVSILLILLLNHFIFRKEYEWRFWIGAILIAFGVNTCLSKIFGNPDALPIYMGIILFSVGAILIVFAHLRDDKKKPEQDVVEHKTLYLWSRGCFYATLSIMAYSMLLLLLGVETPLLFYLLLLMVAGAVATIVLSIIHLVRINSRKAFPITALIISVALVLMFASSFLYA